MRTDTVTAQDKQARLLSQEAGHFSLVRALHLADFITELNGTTPLLNDLKDERTY